MVRTTPEAVAEIIEADAAISMTPFIAVASSVVDDHCLGVGLTDAKLLLIETWLGAHFYSLRDRRVVSEKAGPVSENKDPVVLGKALEQSTYGQTAMMLDTSGKLAAWNKAVVEGRSQAPEITYLGTCPEDVVYGDY